MVHLPQKGTIGFALQGFCSNLALGGGPEDVKIMGPDEEGFSVAKRGQQGYLDLRTIEIGG